MLIGILIANRINSTNWKKEEENINTKWNKRHPETKQNIDWSTIFYMQYAKPKWRKNINNNRKQNIFNFNKITHVAHSSQCLQTKNHNEYILKIFKILKMILTLIRNHKNWFSFHSNWNLNPFIKTKKQI